MRQHIKYIALYTISTSSNGYQTIACLLIRVLHSVPAFLGPGWYMSSGILTLTVVSYGSS